MRAVARDAISTTAKYLRLSDWLQNLITKSRFLFVPMASAAGQMLAPLHGLLIRFLGAGLHIAVDRCRPTLKLASVLKLLVSLAILTVLADIRALH
jgi:hypothetical protein